MNTPATYIDYTEAVFASSLSSNAKLAALVIAKHYNWTKREACWPANATLSEMSSMSVTTLGRAKKELIEAGWLEVTRQFDNSNLYVPTVPAGFAPEAAKAEKKANRKPVTKKAQKAPVAPEMVEKASEVTEPVVEPEKAPEGMSDAEAQAVLDLDPWADEEPVVEAPAKPAKKTKKAEAAEKKSLLAQKIDEARSSASLYERVVEDKLNGSDDPEKAWELFKDETYRPDTLGDPVRRASMIDIDVWKQPASVGASKAVDHDSEW